MHKNVCSSFKSGRGLLIQTLQFPNSQIRRKYLNILFGILYASTFLIFVVFSFILRICLAPMLQWCAAVPTGTRGNREGYKSKTHSDVATQCQDKKCQPTSMVNLKVTFSFPVISLILIPSQDWYSPPDAWISRIPQERFNSACTRSSNWNKKAAKLFRKAFLSLIYWIAKTSLIEAIFLTHVDYLRKAVQRK